jgi:two-component system sensor histidine kinase KdpD
MSSSTDNREPGRPTPEQMLVRLQEEQGVETPSTSPGTGRLRIFLGAAPGVGKTYEMLVEAREDKQGGTDVVIGFVETYNRPNTAAQIDDLEIVPRERIEYGGIVLEEMDMDAVIARHPQIALVDELAHTNAHGSKHHKRYEDVLDLLQAGIDVWTTMNVQHIESLHTAVETITGVGVRETVPDWVVDKADEVSLVDVSVEEMHRRMKEGNIYPAAQARMALQNFFRKGNLTALRELALRRTAENVDTALERYMQEHEIEVPWAATERILVAVDHLPFSKDLIRRGWYLARGLKASLVAVHVNNPSQQLTPEDEANLRSNLEVAEDLGADVETLEGSDIEATLARYAKDKHITQIVVGKTRRGRIREALDPSMSRRLLDIVTQDVHIVSPIGPAKGSSASGPASGGAAGGAV